jgi:oxaloacetate decarboxylase alpha subunit
MKIETIEELVDVLQRSTLTRLELESDKWSLSLERPQVAPRAATATTAAAPARTAPSVEEPRTELTLVESPIVGVFHEATPPIMAGQTVRAGEVLGSIDSLSLRNDVRAPIDGDVTEVHVEEGQPVEFGQQLFTVIPGAPE